ncbi:ABC transporter permease [Imbroritus primus]|uniref:ABC transporter permease n=1 Tax=Imbroritus primus TaxID=3058603 RepID=UPI003D160AF3
MTTATATAIETTAAKASKRENLVILVLQVLMLVIFFVLWEVVSRNKWIDPLFIGHPSKIFEYLYEAMFVDHKLFKEAGWTLWSTAAAFVLGSLGGMLFGLLFVVYPPLEKFLEPLFSAMNSLPRIALAPLFLLWFGLGPASKIALGFSLTFFIVLNSTVAGARSVDSDWVTLSRMLGASKATIFFKVTLVSAVPTIFSGLRLGLIYALLGVIGGEIIASQHGLGQLLSYLAGTFDTNGVFGVLFFLALLGVALTKCMSLLESYLLRWK